MKMEFNVMSKIENMVPVCTKMPRALLEQARAAARAEGISFGELIRCGVREYMRRSANARIGMRKG